MNRKYFFLDSPRNVHDFMLNPDFSASLSVQNFLTLKNIHIDLNKYLILIGPQAEGKSLLVKLCYFFYDEIVRCHFHLGYRDAKRSMRHNFTTYFPRMTWKNDDFSIDFSMDTYFIRLSNKDGRFSIEFGEIFERDVRRLIKENTSIFSLHSSYKKFFNDSSASKIYSEFSSDIPYAFQTFPIFMPAIRQLYSHAKGNVFKFLDLSSDNDYDVFLQKFGALYEMLIREDSLSDTASKSIYDILKAKYKNINGKRYIENRLGKVIPLCLSSSGQQEAMPLIAITHLLTRLGRFFIEEPETHLFPTTQKKIIYDIAACVNRNRATSVIITTHSPYVLSSLNNLIAAHDVLLLKDTDKEKEVETVVGRNKWINFDDISCYYINNGIAENIMDASYRMINFEKIDACSSEIVNELNEILKVTNSEDE